MKSRVRWAVVAAKWRAIKVRDRMRVVPLPDVIVDIEVDGVRVMLRAPRRSDFDEWRAARLREQHTIEPFWADDERSWPDRHKTGDWLDLIEQGHSGRRTRTSLLSMLTVDGRLAGHLNLEHIDYQTRAAEIGAWTSPEFSPLYTLKAFAALCVWARRELGLDSIYAPIHPANSPAIKAAHRCGLRYVGPNGDGRLSRYEVRLDDDDTAPSTEVSAFHTSQQMQAELHHLVPGGAHTYARGEDQYPDGMAPILLRGNGSHVTDVDGNCYIEYGAGLRSVTLGHAFRPVVEAVTDVLRAGNNFSRPTELELLAAQDFLQTVPTAEMVKFAKNGSDATTAAVRLARAVTGRTTIARCDQPFFSVDDWFIGSTPMNSGIPPQDVVTFPYNDLDSLEKVLRHNTIAAVMLEPATAMAEPSDGFLAGVRALCDRYGSLLIFDETITGFRWSAHGAQHVYAVTPDLSCWGKALGNGFPISALAGRREVMQRGGLDTADDRVFLLSTTHGPESSALAAMRAVLATYQLSDPVTIMERSGRRLVDGINSATTDHGLADYLYATGRPSCAVFVTRDGQGVPSQAYRTLVLQEMISRGILGQSLVVSAAHTDRDIDRTIEVFADIMPIYRRAIDAGSVDGLLRGRPVAPALRRTAAPKTPYIAKESSS